MRLLKTIRLQYIMKEPSGQKSHNCSSVLFHSAKSCYSGRSQALAASVCSNEVSAAAIAGNPADYVSHYLYYSWRENLRGPRFQSLATDRRPSTNEFGRSDANPSPWGLAHRWLTGEGSMTRRLH